MDQSLRDTLAAHDAWLEANMTRRAAEITAARDRIVTLEAQQETDSASRAGIAALVAELDAAP